MSDGKPPPEECKARVTIYFRDATDPVIHNCVCSTYALNGLYSLYLIDGTTVKYPLSRIQKVIDDFTQLYASREIR